jgi:hypothetical protein
MVRSEQDVENLVRENQNLVYHAVNRYLQRYFVGVMEREDLVSWGLSGRAGPEPPDRSPATAAHSGEASDDARCDGRRVEQ